MIRRLISSVRWRWWRRRKKRFVLTTITITPETKSTPLNPVWSMSWSPETGWVNLSPKDEDAA